MADLNFPLNPQVNDLYTLNGKTFRYPKIILGK